MRKKRGCYNWISSWSIIWIIKVFLPCFFERWCEASSVKFFMYQPFCTRSADSMGDDFVVCMFKINIKRTQLKIKNSSRAKKNQFRQFLNIEIKRDIVKSTLWLPKITKKSFFRILNILFIATQKVSIN